MLKGWIKRHTATGKSLVAGARDKRIHSQHQPLPDSTATVPLVRMRLKTGEVVQEHVFGRYEDELWISLFYLDGTPVPGAFWIK